jgi:hypothetical protein
MDPIPRPFAYLIGAVAILLLLSPFWILWLKDALEHERPLVTDDAGSTPLPSSTDTNTPSAVLGKADAGSASTIDEFHGIHLDTNLGDLEHRYSVRLQNTRGMVPEIYAASRAGDIENITMHFYNNLLKEFWVDIHERRVVPDQIEKELRERYGEPKERTADSIRPTGPGLGLSLPSAVDAAKASTDRETKLAGFPHQVDLTWADEQTQAEATIYYTSTEPATCSSLLSVHISAAHWLDTNRPQIGPVATPSSPMVTNILDQPPDTSAPAETPKRLFP